MKRNRGLLFCLSIIMCLVILPGCDISIPGLPASNQSSQQNSTPAPQQIGSLVTLPSFADLIDRVQPSVVAVNTQTVVKSRFIQRTVQGAGSGWLYAAFIA